MGAWDQAKPSASTSLANSNPEILANWVALESAIGQDHEFSTGGTNSGKHLQVTFDANLSASPATVAADEGVLYLLDVGSKAELHFEDEDENTIQMTSGGDLYSSTGLTVVNNGSVGGTLGVTGNTTVGGTLDIGSTTAVAGTLDEDDMASDSATNLATQQSIKAYVDANDVYGDTASENDSESNAMVKGQAYLAQTSGFVTAWSTVTISTLVGWVGATDDPAGAGVRVAQSQPQTIAAEGDPFVSFFVPNGKYFELTCGTGTVTIVWTPFVTGGGAPIDQD
jgi:hypothetical protein